MKFHLIINLGLMCKMDVIQLNNFIQLSVTKDALMGDMCQNL